MEPTVFDTEIGSNRVEEPNPTAPIWAVGYATKPAASWFCYESFTYGPSYYYFVEVVVHEIGVYRAK